MFLLSLPFLLATAVFCYVPLFGWSYAFFEYRAGFSLWNTEFVGLKYFMTPFSNPVLRGEILRVMRNTLAMSFLSILSSPLAMLYAVFLNEIKCMGYRKSVQVLTTIPNFISWVLVYSVVFSLLSLDGFVNKVLLSTGAIDQALDFMGTGDHVWLTQWAYSQWKGLGWGAIMYISAVSGIDTEMYEAAEIDGANRFGKIFHITIPNLLPTYFVLLLLSIGNLLNNGMEQYYVFSHALNKDYIEVLDLYVYHQGITGGYIPYATSISMFKSIVSLILLSIANGLSKLFRGQSVF